MPNLTLIYEPEPICTYPGCPFIVRQAYTHLCNTHIEVEKMNIKLRRDNRERLYDDGFYSLLNPN